MGTNIKDGPFLACLQPIFNLFLAQPVYILFLAYLFSSFSPFFSLFLQLTIITHTK